MNKLFQLLILSFCLPIHPFSQDEDCMKIGTNFHFFDAGIYKDLKISSYQFYTRNVDYMDTDDDWDSHLATTMAQDENGYALEIPFTHPETGLDQFIAFTIGGNSHNYEAGDYVLLYEGEGDIQIVSWSLAEITSSTDGRIEFTIDEVDENGVHFLINSSTLGNHIHNIRIVQTIYEDNFETEPYLPQFAEKLNSFNTLRFMDFVLTNNQTTSTWAERTNPNFHSQNIDPTGLSWENLIEMANHFDKNIWINVPHLADADYIAQLATLFRDNLKPELTIYLEFSNECWNWIFQQTAWLYETGPFIEQHGRNYGYYSNEVFQSWETIFGTESDRIKTVLAGQTYFVYEALVYLEEEGELDIVDYVSYPGYNALTEADYDVLDVLGADATADDVMDLFDENIEDNYNEMSLFKEFCADDFNKEFVMYEGGQHIIPRVFGLETPYNEALYAAQTTTRMADFYTNMLTYYKDSLEVRLFVHYVLASEQASPYGSWGLVNNYFVETPYSPKWNAVMDWIDANPCGSDVSIGENETADNTILIYPNPSSGLIKINTSYDVPIELVTVFDINGQLLYTIKNSTSWIDLSALSSGIYWVTVQTADTIFRNKIVIE